MTVSHALALALVVSAHVVALAAWDRHLVGQPQAAAVGTRQALAPTVRLAASPRPASEADLLKSVAP